MGPSPGSSPGGDLVAVVCAACKVGASVTDAGRAVASLVPPNESGRARVALALRRAADRLLGDGADRVGDSSLLEHGTPFTSLVNLSIELSKENLCVFNAPFVLIEDLLMSRTVSELASVFDLVEHYVDILAQSNLVQSQKGWGDFSSSVISPQMNVVCSEAVSSSNLQFVVRTPTEDAGHGTSRQSFDTFSAMLSS